MDIREWRYSYGYFYNFLGTNGRYLNRHSGRIAAGVDKGFHRAIIQAMNQAVDSHARVNGRIKATLAPQNKS